MGGREASNSSLQQGHQREGILAQEEDDTNLGHSHSHGRSHNHRHGIAGRYSHKAAGCLGFILNVTGVDRFTRGKAANGMARAGKAPNPFDTGLISNCVDFWTKGGEIGVQYETLYDVPAEGFRASRRRREGRSNGDVEGGGANDNASIWSSGKKRGFRFFPRFLGGGRGYSHPYQGVSMEEV